MQANLFIYSNSASHQAAWSALRFAEAWIASGRNISHVFFYGDGVYIANPLSAPPRDEMNLATAWSKFCLKHDVAAIICVAAAIRRGVLDSAEAKRQQRPYGDLLTPFELGGLGQFIDATLSSDRTIYFGRH